MVDDILAEREEEGWAIIRGGKYISGGTEQVIS